MIYDVTDTNSYNQLKFIVESIKGVPSKECIKVIIGNKCDLKNLRQITSSDGEKVAKANNVLFYEVSALKDGKKIREIVIEVAKSLIMRSFKQDEYR